MVVESRRRRKQLSLKNFSHGKKLNTGLGLYISRKIIELHGGRIWYEDSAEGGAKFCLELPRHAPENSKSN